MRRSLSLIGLLAGLLAGGCSRTAGPQPPELHLGEDACSRCHMQVDDARFAAARQVGQEVQLFDDLGELFEMRRERPAGQEPEAVWVHDYDTGQWLEARQATYVQCWGLKTPMGYGILAVGSRPAAEQIAPRFKGKPVTFEETQASLDQQAEGGKSTP